MHTYEYQLIVTCADEDCSEFEQDVYSITTQTRDLASPDAIQVIRAEERHEDEEQEYQDLVEEKADKLHKMLREKD